MLKIRLQRVGRVNNPSFRLVLTDSHNSTKSGRYVEVLGHFDYRASKSDASPDNHLNAEKIKHWISKGAQPTPSVHNLLLEKGIITGKKINVLPRKSPPKKEEPAAVGGAPAGAASATGTAETSAAPAGTAESAPAVAPQA